LYVMPFPTPGLRIERVVEDTQGANNPIVRGNS